MSLSFKDGERKTMDHMIRFRHEIFRSIMTNSVNGLKNLSEFESNLNYMHYFDEKVERAAQGLFDNTLLMAQELNILTNGQYKSLYDILLNIHVETRSFFEKLDTVTKGPLILSLNNNEALDAWQVGAKAAKLAFFNKFLPDVIPQALIITSSSYELLLDSNNLRNRIRLLLNDPGLSSKPELLKKHAKTIRTWIREAIVPKKIQDELNTMINEIAINSGDLWAVRSSVVSEETAFSFSGLFDHQLGVPKEDISKVYLKIIASHFSEQVLKIRIKLGIREIKMPMSVMIMKMIEPVFKGAIFTRDIDHPEDDTLVLSLVGTDLQKTKTYQLSTHHSTIDDESIFDHFAPPQVESLQSIIPKLCKTARLVSDKTGSDIALEWILDGQGRLQILQGRTIQVQGNKPLVSKSLKKITPLSTGGITVYPGRAEGEVVYLTSKQTLDDIKKGSIIVSAKPRLDLVPVIPDLAALLLMEGDLSDPISILAQECSVPCICQMGPILNRLTDISYISVDATRKQVFEGSCWAGVKERTLARIMNIHRNKISESLYQNFLVSNLSSVEASDFKTKSCNSILDIIHFASEMSVRSLFKFGDKQKRSNNSAVYELKAKLPLQLNIVDMDKSVLATETLIPLAEIKNASFAALWKGISDERLHWPNRWENEMMGLPGDLRMAVLSETKEPRKSKAPNYAILSNNYMNFNARISYHYIMVDTIIGPGVDNNHIFFRFRGSGGSNEGVQRCAEFIENILKKYGFAINRNNEVVTSWLMYTSSKDSQLALENLGRLIVCARELDAVLKLETDTKFFTDSFLNGEYNWFA